MPADLPAGLDGVLVMHDDQSVVILVRVEYVTERPLDRVAHPRITGDAYVRETHVFRYREIDAQVLGLRCIRVSGRIEGSTEAGVEIVQEVGRKCARVTKSEVLVSIDKCFGKPWELRRACTSGLERILLVIIVVNVSAEDLVRFSQQMVDAHNELLAIIFRRGTGSKTLAACVGLRVELQNCFCHRTDASVRNRAADEIRSGHIAARRAS